MIILNYFVAFLFRMPYINNMSNGEIQMTNRSKKYQVKNFVLAAMEAGDTDLEILSELCHKQGKTLVTAKFHIRKYRKVFVESKRTKIVKNLMTGQDIEILASTPYCCNPSLEAYWSM